MADEFSRQVWSADVGLVKPPHGTETLYILVDRKKNT